MKKIEKLEGSYDVPQLKQKLNEIIDYLNTQPQTEENEPEKVYVEPYESANPEGAIKVEWKSRDEIADNLQAQFEYGRHGTYKDLESARKVFDKERVKEWDRIAMETYKQATQDTPEEKECECCKWDDMGYTHEPYCPLFKEYKQDTPEEWREVIKQMVFSDCFKDQPDIQAYIDFIQSLLDEKEEEAEKNLLKRFYNATSKEEFRDVLDKLNK